MLQDHLGRWKAKASTARQGVRREAAAPPWWLLVNQHHLQTAYSPCIAVRQVVRACRLDLRIMLDRAMGPTVAGVGMPSWKAASAFMQL